MAAIVSRHGTESQITTSHYFERAVEYSRVDHTFLLSDYRDGKSVDGLPRLTKRLSQRNTHINTIRSWTIDSSWVISLSNMWFGERSSYKYIVYDVVNIYAYKLVVFSNAECHTWYSKSIVSNRTNGFWLLRSVVCSSRPVAKPTCFEQN
jgi:hypothetical protein